MAVHCEITDRGPVRFLVGMLAGWEHIEKFRRLNTDDPKSKEYADESAIWDKVVGSAIMNETVARSIAIVNEWRARCSGKRSGVRGLFDFHATWTACIELNVAL